MSRETSDLSDQVGVVAIAVLVSAMAGLLIVILVFLSGKTIESLGGGTCHEERLSPTDSSQCSHHSARIEVLTNGKSAEAIICRCGRK